jgi:hypothetical protein
MYYKTVNISVSYMLKSNCFSWFNLSNCNHFFNKERTLYIAKFSSSLTLLHVQALELDLVTCFLTCNELNACAWTRTIGLSEEFLIHNCIEIIIHGIVPKYSPFTVTSIRSISMSIILFVNRSINQMQFLFHLLFYRFLLYVLMTRTK